MQGSWPDRPRLIRASLAYSAPFARTAISRRRLSRMEPASPSRHTHESNGAKRIPPGAPSPRSPGPSTCRSPNLATPSTGLSSADAEHLASRHDQPVQPNSQAIRGDRDTVAGACRRRLERAGKLVSSAGPSWSHPEPLNRRRAGRSACRLSAWMRTDVGWTSQQARGPRRRVLRAHRGGGTMAGRLMSPTRERHRHQWEVVAQRLLALGASAVERFSMPSGRGRYELLHERSMLSPPSVTGSRRPPRRPRAPVCGDRH